ncbi:aldehyde dehydrogenase family protein [Bacillus pacificus]
MKRQKQHTKRGLKYQFPNRSRQLYKYLQLLQENKEELAKIITLENGKTLTDATGEVYSVVLRQ